jgi:Ring finger domain
LLREHSGRARVGPSLRLLRSVCGSLTFTPSQLCRDSVRRIASAVITHAGQSVVCMKMSILEEDLFVLFDPHRRDGHLNGPSFMLSKSRTTTATFLNCILSNPPINPTDVAGHEDNSDACTSSADHFMAHLLDTKETYHKITAYQNEQTLRDTFLCSYEEVLSASIDFVNNENVRHRPPTPDAGPSSPRSHRSSNRSPLLSISSSTSTSSSTVSNPELSTHSITPVPLPNNRFARVLSEAWPPPEPLFPHSYLEWQIKSMLKNSANTTFECAVCLDSVPVTSGVQLHGCEHRFCKDCLKGHVQTSLDNGRYPIECPVCLLDRSVPDPGSEWPSSFCVLAVSDSL